MEEYDSFLTRFKKDLWNQCIQQKIFDFIPNENIEKTKQIFENTISNYQSQILQQEGKGDVQILYATIIQQISNELSPLKNISRDNILQQKKDVFEQQVETKQKEFNMLMNKDPPPTPQFSDEQKDDPLNKKNLEELIQSQMKDRESVMNINQNNVISDNLFTKEPNENPDYKKLEHQLKIQSSILQQIVQSQIAILKKLK